MATNPEQFPPYEWQTRTSPEIAAAAADGVVAILPVGAMEQHGPHLPVDTDTHCAVEVARRVAAQVPNTIILPPVSWGYSVTHIGFAGTLSLSPTTLSAVLEDLCKSLVEQKITKIVLLVAHASNRPVITTFVTEFYHKYHVSLVQVNWVQFGLGAYQRLRKSRTGGAAHAGEFETSVELYLRPELVRQELAVARYIDPEKDFGLPDTLADMAVPGRVQTGYSLHGRFTDGVMGDGTMGDAALGKVIVEEAVSGIVTVVAALARKEAELP